MIDGHVFLAVVTAQWLAGLKVETMEGNFASFSKQFHTVFMMKETRVLQLVLALSLASFLGD